MVVFDESEVTELESIVDEGVSVGEDAFDSAAEFQVDDELVVATDR